jgi:hypothetical protein
MDALTGGQSKLSVLMTYEASRFMFSQPFNRYAWFVELPQSIADFISLRAEQSSSGSPLPSTAAKKFFFRTIICDEAQALRSIRGMLWRMVRLLPSRHFGFATATPSLNKVTDWLAFTKLIWKRSAIAEQFDPGADIALWRLLEESFIPTYSAGSHSMITVNGDDTETVKQLKEWDELLSPLVSFPPTSTSSGSSNDQTTSSFSSDSRPLASIPPI